MDGRVRKQISGVEGGRKEELYNCVEIEEEMGGRKEEPRSCVPGMKDELRRCVVRKKGGAEQLRRGGEKEKLHHCVVIKATNKC